MTRIPGPLTFRDSRTMRRPKAPDWLWKPYLPVGRLTLVDGSEGIGKGFFAMHIAAEMVLKAGGNVLWFTAEDDPEEDLYRRLLATGWDKDRDGTVFFYDGLEEQDVFGMPRDTKRLVKAIQDVEPALVVLDPGRSFLKAPDAGQQMSYNDDSMVRPGLQKLNQVAAQAKVAMPFIHHWKRDNSSAPSERFAGSGAFSQACRHRVTLARYGIEDDAEAVFAVTKSNIMSRGHLRHYHLEFVEDLETMRWIEGPLNKIDGDLDTWWRRKDREAKASTLLDQTDEVMNYLKTNLRPGQQVPNRGSLAGVVGVPYRYVEAALQKAKAAGLTKPSGPKGLVWQGTNGAHPEPSDG